jgi:polysaccharide biosynthesis/export protein
VNLPLATQGDPKHNVRVRSGDQLYVPPVTGRLIMVLGEVNTQQAMVYRKGIRLTEALAHAGGLVMSRADRHDIRIIRGPLTEPRVYTTNLKSLTKAWFASTADVLNGLSQVLALANSFAILAVAGAIGNR